MTTNRPGEQRVRPQRRRRRGSAVRRPASAAPVWVIAVDSGIIAGDQHDRRPRDRRGRRPPGRGPGARPACPPRAAPRPPAGRCPVASSDDHPDQDGDRLAAPRPSGTAWRRTSVRRVDGEHARVLGVRLERLPGALQQERVAGRERLARSRGPRPALDRERRRGRRSPVTMPGNTGSPMSAERGGISTSASPVSRPDQPGARRRRDARPYWSTSVRAWRLRSAGIVLGVRSGSSRSPSRRARSRWPRGAAGCPASANSKNPNGRPRSSRPRRTRSRSPGCRSARASTRRARRSTSGISSCDGDRPSRTAITTTRAAAPRPRR